MPRKTIWLVVAVGLLTTDCTHKAVDLRPISRLELDQESSCGFTMAPGEEFYYDLQTRYYVHRSDVSITIQPDTANGPVSPEGLFDKHPCLLRDSGAAYLDRGFYIYCLAPGWTFSSADLDLRADPAINRVLPVYLWPSLGEFQVTDLIDVQFEDSVARDEAERILADFNLRYVEENQYRNLLWEVRLDDTRKGSPLACGNALHVTEGVRWACARQYSTGELAPSRH